MTRNRNGLCAAALAMAIVANWALGGEVWRSTFDSGYEGVSQYQSAPPNGEDMLSGGVVNGEALVHIPQLSIRATGNLFVKSGRELTSQGSWHDLTTSHSALYRFRWTALYEGAQGSIPGEGAYSSVGFMRSGMDWPQLGDLVVQFVNYKDPGTGDYWLRPYALVGAHATGGSTQSYSPFWINLGTDPFSKTYQLVIAYDATTREQTIGLYNALGNPIPHVGGGPAVFSQIVSVNNNAQFDYLGWESDAKETGLANNITAQDWAVDTLIYFDDAQGAFDALATGACCLSDGTCDEMGQASCSALQGAWYGGATDCASVSCPGPDDPKWRATFEASADGVVQFMNPPPAGWDMLGDIADGKLPVSIPALNEFTADNRFVKSGRLVASDGSFQTTDRSRSALFKFEWTALYEGDEGSLPNGHAFSFLGFITSATEWPQQGDLGILVENFRDSYTGDYWVGVRSLASAYGTGGGFQSAGPYWANLGPNPFLKTHYFVISYDAATSTQKVGLYDSAGTALVTATLNVTEQPWFDYLGWQCHAIRVGGPQNIEVQAMNVDEVVYFETADGALREMSRGPCCLPDGMCVDGELPWTCPGQWLEVGTTCDTTTNGCPVGACCLPDGTCADLIEVACGWKGGAWQGTATECGPATCPETQACCLPDGTCGDLWPEACTNSLGTAQGAGTSCATTSCPPLPPGACCLPTGACTVLTDFACNDADGLWQGENTTCGPSTCPAGGACCLADGTCAELAEFGCEAEHGTWSGAGTACASTTCPGASSPVWWSTFDADADGVAQFMSLPPSGFDMLGTPAGGELPVAIPMLNHRQGGNLFVKSGRPLIAPGNYGDTSTSHSGLYRFRWTSLYEAPPNSIVANPALPGGFTYVGFVSTTAPSEWPQQGDLGAILVNYKDAFTGEYWLGIYANAAAYGTGGGPQTHGPVWASLGTDPFSKTYQLIVAFDAATSAQTIALYDDTGIELVTVSQMVTEVPSFDYLGWQSYTIEAGGVINLVPQAIALDDLAYFDTANGAIAAVRSVAVGACTLHDTSCTLARLGDCQSRGGTWGGPESVCEPGACCLPFAPCADGLSVQDCMEFHGQYFPNQACIELPCLPLPCPNPDIVVDADGDGDVDELDFAMFQVCYTGAFNPGEQFVGSACHCFDVDADGAGDGDVDLADYMVLEQCLSGPNAAAEATCTGF